jgi:uncharacterized membrane protein
MSELVVFTYQHPDRAAEVLEHVATLQREHIRKPVVTIEDAAVAVKGEDGQVRVRQTLETALKARTGLSTPPGRTFRARRKSAADFR